MMAKVKAKMGSITPILRIFDEVKAKQFYLDFLGFTVDFEHRYEQDLPLYMQVSSGNCVLHLSEHHGDCSPGANIRIKVEHIEALHMCLTEKKYGYARPGLEETDRNTLEITVTDPFYNKLTFYENK